MFGIERVRAREIIDSRGRPTVEVEVYCRAGFGRAAAPSGASTGSGEAVEIRDGGDRFNGMGVRKAVNNVNTSIAVALRGLDVRNIREIDRALFRLDMTEN